MAGSRGTNGDRQGYRVSREQENGFYSPTDHVIQGGSGSRSTFAVLWLIEMAALVIHTAALELAEEVEEAVFIGGVTAQLLHGEWQIHSGGYTVLYFDHSFTS